MVILLNSGKVYGVNEKCTAQHKRGESTPQYKKTLLCEHSASESQFPRYGLVMFKVATLSLNAGYCTSE
jgi:hypothetical protein